MGCLTDDYSLCGFIHKDKKELNMSNTYNPSNTINFDSFENNDNKNNEKIIININNINNANNNIQNLQNDFPEEKDNIINFDKNLCKKKFNTLPKREKTTLRNLKDTFKEKTNNLLDVEKAYVIFLWICDNISYDANSLYAGRIVDCTPNGTFKNGKSVCSGYARLFQDIGQYIGLEIENISCYSKGEGYEPGDDLQTTNHEYNIIKLNNKYYPIDSTWGAGNLEKRKFKKQLNEFYFLPDPELLIKTHFPANKKWQLTKKVYTKEEFLKWPNINNNFYLFGFNKYTPEEGYIELSNINTQKFIIWGDDISKKSVSSSIYLLNENTYYQQLNLDCINFYDEKVEFEFIFNKKGRYKITIFGNNKEEKIAHLMMTYIISVQNNSLKELKFPVFYSDAKEINLIEPKYDNIKYGQKTKFKIKSKLDTIIIIDGNWHYVNNDGEDIFEDEFTIKTEPGKNVIIAKRKDNNDCSCSYMVAYTVLA